MSPEKEGKSQISPRPEFRQMRGLCFLVFGISGVGKTTACKQYLRAHPQFIYVRASAVLSAARAKSADALRTVDAQEFVANQELIVRHLMAVRHDNPDSPILADVHAIIDNDEELLRVPLDIVRSMRANAFVLLEAPSETVLLRRDSLIRSRSRRTKSEIEFEMTIERETVLSYAKALDLPLEIGISTDGFVLDHTIGLLRRRIEE
jgi:adenylate kinase